MKKILLLLFFITVTLFGGVGNVKLAWDANTESDLAGYKIHYGVSSRFYTNSVNVSNITTGVISNLITGVTYYFAVTAYNTSGLESEFSNEVSYTPPTISSNLPSQVISVELDIKN